MSNVKCREHDEEQEDCFASAAVLSSLGGPIKWPDRPPLLWGIDAALARQSGDFEGFIDSLSSLDLQAVNPCYTRVTVDTGLSHDGKFGPAACLLSTRQSLVRLIIKSPRRRRTVDPIHLRNPTATEWYGLLITIGQEVLVSHGHPRGHLVLSISSAL